MQASLRATYTRESKYSLNRNNYSGPRERYGRVAIPWYSQDHLLLPPVPQSSSTLAPLEGTNDEHKVGQNFSGTQTSSSSSTPQCVSKTRLRSRYSRQCAHQEVEHLAVLSGKH